MSTFARPRLAATVVASLVAVLCVAVSAPSAQAQATRTWVSGVGDDVNPCSRTAPCRTFQGAYSKTVASGVISTLDPGGYGALTVTKSITVDGTAGGSILSPGFSGVVVNAGADDVVTLRNIDIQSPPPSACDAPNVAGIRLLRAGTLTVEGLNIDTSAAGIRAAPSTTSRLLVDGVRIRGTGCDAGVHLAPTGSGRVDATIRDTTIVNKASALRVADGGRAWLMGSTLTGNGLALEPLGTGEILDYFGTNQIHGNAADGAPTTVLGRSADPVAGPMGPVGASGPQGPAGPTTAGRTKLRCVVPTVKGLTPAAAGRKLRRVGCNLGTVRRRTTTRSYRVGRVVTQTRDAGTVLRRGTRVGVAVGRRHA